MLNSDAAISGLQSTKQTGSWVRNTVFDFSHPCQTPEASPSTCRSPRPPLCLLHGCLDLHTTPVTMCKTPASVFSHLENIPAWPGAWGGQRVSKDLDGEAAGLCATVMVSGQMLISFSWSVSSPGKFSFLPGIHPTYSLASTKTKSSFPGFENGLF